MNGYPNFDLGPVQPGDESEASNSTAGVNAYVKWDSLSQETKVGSESRASNSVRFHPYSLVQQSNMDSRQISGFSHTPVTAARAKNLPRKLQVRGDSDDSDNTDIQNFIRTLQGCTYSDNSCNQLEDSMILTLAPPIPNKNALIQYEKTWSNDPFAAAFDNFPRPMNIVEAEASHAPHGFDLQDTFSSIHPTGEVRPSAGSLIKSPTQIVTGEYDADKNPSPSNRKQAKRNWTLLRCAVILCFVLRGACSRDPTEKKLRMLLEEGKSHVNQVFLEYMLKSGKFLGEI